MLGLRASDAFRVDRGLAAARQVDLPVPLCYGTTETARCAAAQPLSRAGEVQFFSDNQEASQMT